LALREAGYSGPVTLVGEEPHLPYERPPLSKDALTADFAPDPKWISPAKRYEEANISCLTGQLATAIDRKEKSILLFDGIRLSYDKLLLATGAAPRQLTAAGSGIAYLRTHADALAIRNHLHAKSHLVIVGAGFIGLELAASARRRCARVTVVEALPRILMRSVPETIARVLADRHRREGVDLHCGSRIRSVDSRSSGVTVALESGDEIAADLLVAGIGVMPRTILAEQARLAIDNGIAVDTFLATSDPDIFAAGDCCSFPLAAYGGRRMRLESWRSAQEQGGLAARNMLGAKEPIVSVPWFWSDQYDLTLQVTGVADGAQETVRRELGDGAFILFHLDGGGRLVAASGIGKGNTVARDIRLAEMLIAKGTRPAVEHLASPDIRLKTLLAA
jgi:3-phenylpropionate/trans-cinnamate dioxygenase ferredoxin reductase subunit